MDRLCPCPDCQHFDSDPYICKCKFSAYLFNQRNCVGNPCLGCRASHGATWKLFGAWSNRYLTGERGKYAGAVRQLLCLTGRFSHGCSIGDCWLDSCQHVIDHGPGVSIRWIETWHTEI